MKITDRCYVLMKIGNVEIGEETSYLDVDDNFTNDIRKAAKAVNRVTALDMKYEYETNKNNNYESDLKIVPLKVVYEW